MKSWSVAAWALAGIASVTFAHRAADCLEESIVVGGKIGEFADTVQYSDLDLIQQLDIDHQLTLVKVCTDRAVTYIKGVQVSYGKFSPSDEIIDPISLYPFGDVNQATSVCTNFYVPKDDYIMTVLYRYNNAGIRQLWLTTSKGKSSSYGVADSDDASIVNSYGKQGNMFFGFQGLEERQDIRADFQLKALGFVFYEYKCVNDEKIRLGPAFSWGFRDDYQPDITEPVPPIIVETPNTTTNTTTAPTTEENPEPFKEEKETEEEESSEEATPENIEDQVNSMADDIRDLPDWQRFTLYGTLGLNLLFILFLTFWCCLSRGCARSKEPSLVEKELVKSIRLMREREQNESARVELQRKNQQLTPQPLPLLPADDQKPEAAQGTKVVEHHHYHPQIHVNKSQRGNQNLTTPENKKGSQKVSNQRSKPPTNKAKWVEPSPPPMIAAQQSKKTQKASEKITKPKTVVAQPKPAPTPVVMSDPEPFDSDPNALVVEDWAEKTAIAPEDQSKLQAEKTLVEHSYGSRTPDHVSEMQYSAQNHQQYERVDFSRERETPQARSLQNESQQQPRTRRVSQAQPTETLTNAREAHQEASAQYLKQIAATLAVYKSQLADSETDRQ